MKNFINQSKKILTGAMAALVMFSSALPVQAEPNFDPIHSYIADRKTDVWDFGGVEETDTEKYENHIQKSFYDDLDAALFKSPGVFVESGTYEFDDLVWLRKDNDRIYYNNADSTAGGKNSADKNKDKYKFEFEDGYTSRGAYYASGVGEDDGKGNRCVEVKNVLPGDKITVYIMVENNDMDLHFLYEGSEGEQDDIISLVTKQYTKKEFIAEYAGTYKLYLNNGKGKPRFLRVTRTPNVLIKGTVDLGGNTITDYSVVLEDKTSGKQMTATLYEDGTFAALVPADTTLTAILTGVKGYGFTDISKVISVTDTAVENIELVVEEKKLGTLSGVISGFAQDFDKSNLKMVLSCTDPSLLKEDITLEVAADWTYSVELEEGVEYRLTMTGANDYNFTEDVIIQLTGDNTKEIVVKAKELYPVSGKFLGLAEDAKVEKISFVNLDDEYTYTGMVTEDGYTGDLRTGEYEILAPVDGYKMVGHIVVDQASAEKDLLYLSTAKEEMDLVSDLYVGYPSSEQEEGAFYYETVKEAVKACAAMNPSSEAERITVHIYPGTYREQVTIETPYLTFINDYPEQEVLLTWYYGVGYKYYSVNADGYYDENLAFDKYAQNSVSKWGASVYLKTSATDFKAENITFETSFNRYLTEEEVADGAQPDMKEAIRVLREGDVDVRAKTSTERACALAIDADRAEFKNCTILGSQDTLFIQNKTHTYFKECLISGNTDYIFGDGDAVFERCELQWYGYSDKVSGGYITAVQNQAPKGCLFLNCHVTANPELLVENGCFGRPWREGAHVVFFNTVLESEDLIRPVGWADMSGGKAENSFFREFNTTLPDGTAVDTSERIKDTVISAEEAEKIHAEDYFADWMPSYYTEKEPEEPDKEVLKVEKFEDLTIDISKEGISKQEIMAKVPTGAAVTCTSGEKMEAEVVWDDSKLEETYTKSTELTLTGTLKEFETVDVTIKVVLVAPKDPEKPSEPEKPEKPDKPSRPSDDDDDDDDEDDSEEIRSDLTYSEQNKVEEVFGSSARIQEVVESNTGKLVISVEKEIVFCEKNGTLSKDKWQLVDGSWYYFGSDNKAVSGWLKTGNKWYFMDQMDKKMETGWLKTADGKWYLLDSVNGDMKTGWQMRGGKWYLLDGINGDMKIGWQQTADGKWYYMSASGEMAANTITPDGYQVGPTGAWIH